MNIFEKQLNFGKKYEKKFAELTKKKYRQSEGLTHWDIEIIHDNKPIKYEVKTDKRTNETGNFAVEFESNNKLSGISITEADYWVFNEIIDYNKSKGDNYDYEFISYLIPTDKLIKMINGNRFKVYDVCEKNKNKVYIINKSYFEKYKVNINENNFFAKKFEDVNYIDNKNYTIDELEKLFNEI